MWGDVCEVCDDCDVGVVIVEGDGGGDDDDDDVRGVVVGEAEITFDFEGGVVIGVGGFGC